MDNFHVADGLLSSAPLILYRWTYPCHVNWFLKAEFHAMSYGCWGL